MLQDTQTLIEKVRVFQKWFDMAKGEMCPHEHFLGWELVGCTAGSPPFKVPDTPPPLGTHQMKSRRITTEMSWGGKGFGTVGCVTLDRACH